jgi:phosphatidylinositol 3-kinase
LFGYFNYEIVLCYKQEAKQAVELMGRWETIDVTDALELLSPLFESEEVSAYF